MYKVKLYRSGVLDTLKELENEATRLQFQARRRIILPDVQCGLASELGPEFYVALPCRDWFVCWSKEQAAEFQTRNAADALRIFLEDEYNLTPDILLFDGTRFSLHQAQTVDA